MGLEMIGVFRKEKGITLDELSEKSGVPVSTIKKISAGITTDPNLSTVQALALALGCSIDDFSNTSRFGDTFSSAEKKIIKKYRTLDEYGKGTVNLVLEREYNRITNREIAPLIQKRETAQPEEPKAPETAAKPEEVVYYVISGFYQPMSAGTGAEAGDGGPEDFMLTKRPPRGASYVAPVSGDSMEPTFHDGDELFVHACDQIEPGRIGVFFMDGKQWVKELGDGVLLSHNPAYEPIPITPDIRCQGLVLGVCDSSYFG